MPVQNTGTSKRGADAPTVTGNIAAPAKRSRVSRACDQCRIAREKCDGKPVCSTCALSKRTCTYTANPKKRGIQPGYLRTLELALTWLFNNSSAESLLNRKLSEEGAASVLLQRDSKESNRLHKSWRKSRFCRDVDALLSGGAILEESARSPSPESDDGESESGTFMQPDSHTLYLPHPSPVTAQPTRGEPEAPHIQDQQGHGQAHYRERLLDASRNLQGQAVSLPSNLWRLFDIYFAYTHSWFPVCEKHHILKLSYSYPEEGLRISPDMRESGDHAELWAVLALASLQEQSDNPNLSTGHASTSKRAYDIAQSLVAPSTSSSIGHARALLLLALICMYQSGRDAAWILLGRASRIAIALESHSSQVSRLKHVVSACFLLDHLLSMEAARRPYLQVSDIQRVGRVEEEGLDEYQPWSGCMNSGSANSLPKAPALSLSTYNRLIDLVGLMSIITTSSTPANSAQEAAAKLDAWKTTLPAQQRQALAHQLPIATAPPALLLRAVYCCARIVTNPSRSSVESFLEVVEHIIKQFGHIALPSIVRSLLRITMRSTETILDEDLKVRLRNVHIGHHYAESQGNNDGTELYQDSSDVAIPASGQSQLSAPPMFSPAIQAPTPESIQLQLHPPYQLDGRMRTTPAVVGAHVAHLEPTMRYSQPQILGFDQHQSSQPFSGPQLDPRLDQTVGNDLVPEVGRDMESFFDELASLDGAGRLETQPQFMQNLGFAPDANFADLLARDFGHINSSLSPYNQESFRAAPPLDQAGYFDGG